MMRGMKKRKKNIYDRDIIYEQIYSLPKKNKPRCLVISDYKNNLLRYFSNIVKVENYGSKDFRSKWYIHFYKICLYNEKNIWRGYRWKQEEYR